MRNQAKILIIAGVLFTWCLSMVSAQSGESSHIDIIRFQAESGIEEFKIDALESVDQLLEENNADASSQEILEIVIKLAIEPYSNPQRTGISPIIANDHPNVRYAAAVLLGKIGGLQAINGLLQMLKHEQNNDVLKNIMYALGNIGQNPEARVTQAIARRIKSLDNVEKIDEELAFASLFAIGEVSSIDTASDELYQTILILYGDRYSQLVQDKAWAVLQKLWQKDQGSDQTR